MRIDRVLIFAVGFKITTENGFTQTAGKIVEPLSQAKRPKSPLVRLEADLKKPNENWTRGLQSQREWTWSGHLNPASFPTTLVNFFYICRGVFEKQLYFSTVLIFDEPSFRNGVQVSGFVDRISKELSISLIRAVGSIIRWRGTC
jgi:hypothetical protein